MAALVVELKAEEGVLLRADCTYLVYRKLTREGEANRFVIQLVALKNESVTCTLVADELYDVRAVCLNDCCGAAVGFHRNGGESRGLFTECVVLKIKRLGLRRLLDYGRECVYGVYEGFEIRLSVDRNSVFFDFKRGKDVAGNAGDRDAGARNVAFNGIGNANGSLL